MLKFLLGLLYRFSVGDVYVGHDALHESSHRAYADAAWFLEQQFAPHLTMARFEDVRSLGRSELVPGLHGHDHAFGARRRERTRWSCQPRSCRR